MNRPSQFHFICAPRVDASERVTVDVAPVKVRHPPISSVPEVRFRAGDQWRLFVGSLRMFKLLVGIDGT